uniref:Uncharacterized protein n=1 Tax=Eutreptiella gymnastica TaxID=73025 RepID=A0A7S1J3M7_9EUGL
MDVQAEAALWRTECEEGQERDWLHLMCEAEGGIQGMELRRLRDLSEKLQRQLEAERFTRRKELVWRQEEAQREQVESDEAKLFACAVCVESQKRFLVLRDALNLSEAAARQVVTDVQAGIRRQLVAAEGQGQARAMLMGVEQAARTQLAALEGTEWAAAEVQQLRRDRETWERVARKNHEREEEAAWEQLQKEGLALRERIGRGMVEQAEVGARPQPEPVSSASACAEWVGTNVTAEARVGMKMEVETASDSDEEVAVATRTRSKIEVRHDERFLDGALYWDPSKGSNATAAARPTARPVTPPHRRGGARSTRKRRTSTEEPAPYPVHTPSLNPTAIPTPDPNQSPQPRHAPHGGVGSAESRPIPPTPTPTPTRIARQAHPRTPVPPSAPAAVRGPFATAVGAKRVADHPLQAAKRLRPSSGPPVAPTLAPTGSADPTPHRARESQPTHSPSPGPVPDLTRPGRSRSPTAHPQARPWPAPQAPTAARHPGDRTYCTGRQR